MRQVQEMSVEFVNALNAAAAAESECAKRRRLLEEERKHVQRLKQEKEDEGQMAKRKIERMSQRLAEAQKDVEYATARADVAENEWVKLKRELRVALDHMQLLKPESEVTRQIVLKQGDDNELGLANAASISESECDKLRTLLEEERKLVQRLTLENNGEAQLAKRQVEEISQELADARKEAEYATTRADVAETELIKAKKELQDQRELFQRLERECEEIRQSATTIAECECDKLKRMLEEEQNIVQKLILDKDAEMHLTKRQIEEIDQELAHAQKDAELARKDADAAQNEWTKVKKDLKNMEEHVKWLELQCQEIRESCSRKDGEKALELANALNASAIAENEWIKVKRELKEKEELVKLLKLEIQDMRQINTNQVEEISQELENARKETEHARNDADIAQDEWTKVKRELKEKEELVKLLKLEIQDMRQINTSQVEEISQELENSRKETEHARNDADIAQNEWIKAKKDLKEKLELIQLLKLECQETSERAMRQVEEKELELADALYAATSASSSSTVAEDCVICLTNEKDMAFGCGHMTCEECGRTLSTCPICRDEITLRVKLFP